jgi:alpha-D-ribose 1-methylphosphonate 5-triphosphate diphosphatase PhnM
MLLAAPLMLLAAPAAADAVGAGRKAFSQCLSAQIQASLDKKVALADFPAAMKAACSAKETAFRAAILADDKASGMSEKDAQADADDQISEYTDKISSEYEDYLKPS